MFLNLQLFQIHTLNTPQLHPIISVKFSLPTPHQQNIRGKKKKKEGTHINCPNPPLFYLLIHWNTRERASTMPTKRPIDDFIMELILRHGPLCTGSALLDSNLILGNVGGDSAPITADAAVALETFGGVEVDYGTELDYVGRAVAPECVVFVGRSICWDSRVGWCGFGLGHNDGLFVYSELGIIRRAKREVQSES